MHYKEHLIKNYNIAYIILILSYRLAFCAYERQDMVLSGGVK